MDDCDHSILIGVRMMAMITKRAPLYEEASIFILRRIVDGELKPGMALPNETQLSAEFGVSLGTLRRALDQLEADRLLDRIQGRGTFVSEEARKEFVSRFSNVRGRSSEVISDAGKVLSQEAREPSELETFRLELRPGQRVLRTIRLLSDNSRVYMHETAVLSLSYFAGVQPESIGNYALSVLALAHGVRLGEAKEGVKPCWAPKEIAKLLGLMLTPVLQLDRTVFTIGGKPIEWRVAHCNVKDTIYQVTMN
jgi:GntR family transcriptional regulator